MKQTYISDITEESSIIGEKFLVARKALLRAKNGAPYLSLTLADRSGQIEARVWDEAERLAKSFAEGGFVRVRAQAARFRGELQLNVGDVEAVAAATLDMADFVPSSERDPEEMLRELKGHCRALGNPHLKALLQLFLKDAAFMAGLVRAVAAKNMHHAYLGGLLEHTLSVARLAREVSAHYPELDGDLLLAAALLHDIGKVREFTTAPGFDYTTQGRLVGHLLLGAEMLGEKLSRLPGFPEGLATALKHLIISHHGEYEFGSPKRPKTAEAFVLHALDDMDAKLAAVRQHLKAAGEAAYHRVLERYIFGPLGGEPEAGRPGEESAAGEAEAAEDNYSLLKPLLKGR